MANSIELDNLSNSWDEHFVSNDHHDLTAPTQVVAQAAPAEQAAAPVQTAPAAAEPVPVDVGGGAPAAAPPAANAPHEYVADASNVVKLPANVSIDNIKVDGHNLVLEQADGSVIVIKDGALHVPTFIIGDVEVPRVALIAALEASHVDVAFGADGSISAGGSTTSSAGGNFEQPAGGIGDGFGLSALLPPTALQFGQPDHRELFPSLLPDSTPSIADLTPSVGGGDTTVNEKGLPASSGAEGSGELAAPGTDGDTSEHNTGTFTITSPDGIGSLTIAGQVISGAALANSASAPIEITTPLGNTLTINGYDASTGQVSYSYTLVHGAVHPGPGTDSIFDDMTLTVTDTDGDVSAPGTLSVQIIDDVPTANADIGTVPSGSHAAITGDVFVNDVFGADGKDAAGGVVGVAAGNTNANLDSAATIGSVIHGTYGTLTLHADGSYSYTRDAGSPGGVNDVFTYTIKDGDGDLAHTTLTIQIADSTPTISGLTPDTSGGDATVYEAGLAARNGEPAGSGEFAATGGLGNGDPSEAATGDFTITSGDGVKSLVIDGITVIQNGALTGTLSVTTPEGNTLTVTNYDAATGKVSYTYTLLDNEQHAAGNGNNALFDNLTITLTDQDNESATGTLSINIVDDVPTASADIGNVPSGSHAAINGDVFVNDVFGADGKDTAGGVVGVTAGTTAGGADANVGTQIHGDYGMLTLNADGTYTYTRNAGSPGGVNDVFTYTIKDGDGDLSHTTLTISVGDSTPSDSIPAP
ncbi:Ig-like domain-containing protein, partial [Mesorhizobium sp. B2-3-15]|uniref:beta strand repeat-containing protein n=1 Tax=Mesorhizobium sp. B2-3-15 TaxID=2589949 RepID=UPI001170E7AF